jgi:hypothetical protein
LFVQAVLSNAPRPPTANAPSSGIDERQLAANEATLPAAHTTTPIYCHNEQRSGYPDTQGYSGRKRISFVTTQPENPATADLQGLVSLTSARGAAVIPTAVWFVPGKRCLRS